MESAIDPNGTAPYDQLCKLRRASTESAWGMLSTIFTMLVFVRTPTRQPGSFGAVAAPCPTNVSVGSATDLKSSYLFDGPCNDVTCNLHALSLQVPLCSGDCLQLDAWIPLWLQDEDAVSNGNVQPKSVS